MEEQMKSRETPPPDHSLNTICPYFTMFPVEFPLAILKGAAKDAIVLDPFCGRGTTNYAARFLGLESYGFDTSPVAAAVAQAKLARTTPDDVLALAGRLLTQRQRTSLPSGKFWRLAYHRKTLAKLCRIRNGLLNDCRSDTAILLRAIMLGGLHGPLSKSLSEASYFSNQMPRTYAAKPGYAVRYWLRNRLKPPEVDVLQIIRRRVDRALRNAPKSSSSTRQIRQADSREKVAYTRVPHGITHVVTSPPYYGLRTYIEDQWLRNWFLGGLDQVPYGQGLQISHESPDAFAKSLAAVWDNIALKASPSIRMVVRFGAIGSRRHDPREILKASLKASAAPWRLCTRRTLAAVSGRSRQANHMSTYGTTQEEYDFYITLQSRSCK
jgi:hypothetical protein